MSSKNVSELGPIDPSSVPDPEKEKEAPWIVRKLAGSMTGRIVMSSLESIRAAGTSVVCLSPWGDSSPLLLPCIRFRDLAMHAIIVGTGGVAAVVAPVMEPVSDVVLPVLGDSIAVEIGMDATFSLTTKAANDLIIEHPLKKLIPSNDRRLYTTSIKTLTITLKFKQSMADASLGFFRSSVHLDTSMFTTVLDYLSIEKGWMSPILFASNRRPIIPRTMKPDVVFCHGPFLSGDYRIAQTLLAESASVISLSEEPSPDDIPLYLQEKPKEPDPYPKYRPISNYIARKKAEHELEKNPPPSIPAVQQKRRLLIILMGIKPHRTDNAWSTSRRPGESLIRYLLLNGCPSVVVPAKQGCPLIAWNTLSLESIWKIAKVEGVAGPTPDQTASLTPEGEETKLDGALRVLFEYVELCIDWDRVIVPSSDQAPSSESADAAVQVDLESESKPQEDAQAAVPASLDSKREAVKNALGALLAGAVKSYESKAVKKDVDVDRAGIALLRMP